MNTTIKAKMHGGPYDGWDFEVVDKGQQVDYLGPPGTPEAACYAYKRGQDFEGITHWVYDERLTNDALMVARLTGRGDVATPGTDPVEEGHDGGETKYIVQLKHDVDKQRWAAIIDGEIAGYAPEAMINSPQEAQAFMAQFDPKVAKAKTKAR